MEKYFYPSSDCGVLSISEESIPKGLTLKDISDLFAKREPIPYIGNEPNFIPIPKELTKSPISF